MKTCRPSDRLPTPKPLHKCTTKLAAILVFTVHSRHTIIATRLHSATVTQLVPCNTYVSTQETQAFSGPRPR